MYISVHYSIKSGICLIYEAELETYVIACPVVNKSESCLEIRNYKLSTFEISE